MQRLGGRGRAGGPSPLVIMAAAIAIVASAWYLARLLWWVFYNYAWLVATAAAAGVVVGVITHEPHLVLLSFMAAVGGILGALCRMAHNPRPRTGNPVVNPIRTPADPQRHQSGEPVTPKRIPDSLTDAPPRFPPVNGRI
jgi:hypothetical protein